MEIQTSNSNNMKTYKEHYKASQEAYKKDKGLFAYPRTKLCDFTVREYGPNKSDDLITVDDKMMSLVGDIAKVVDKRFADPEANCYFPTGAQRRDDPMFRMSQIWNIQPMNEFASLLMPQIEANVFGSYSVIDGLYCYRTFNLETIPKASFLWHYDNHCEERIKLLFYLNDVTEDNGPFEYLWNEKRDTGLVAKTTRIDHTQWRKHHSRIGKDELVTFTEKGFLPKKLLGPAGTFAMFDNNIVHRANIPKPGHYRDVFVLMCRPFHEKLHPHIDKKWTGTNYHLDTNQDPESKTVVKK